jgi:hypothetical protein
MLALVCSRLDILNWTTKKLKMQASVPGAVTGVIAFTSNSKVETRVGLTLLMISIPLDMSVICLLTAKLHI